MRSWRLLAAVLAATGPATSALAEERAAGGEGPGLSLAWALPQLLPSPELLVSRQGSAAGMRWQLTPLLYSFGRVARASRFRAFVVEPLVRHSGSTELFIDPEYLGLGSGSRLGARAGVRTYLPLVEHGEGLSFSFGSSYLRFQGEGSVAFEGGIYALFGIFGLQASYSPRLFGRAALFTLNIRYF